MSSYVQCVTCGDTHFGVRGAADRAPVTKSVTQITANVTESVTERHRFNDGAAS